MRLALLASVVAVGAAGGCVAKRPVPAVDDGRRHDARVMVHSLDQSAAGEPVTVQVQTDEPHHSAMVGQRCTIHFRRDALGMASQGFIEPTARSFAGKPLSIAGEIIAAGETWIQLKSDSGEMWIPTSAILMIQRHRDE